MKKHFLIACLLIAFAPLACLAAETAATPLETEKQKYDRPPENISIPQPQYPFQMRRKGIEGDVVVEFTVNAEGRVREAKVISAPNKDFHRSALASVQDARFKPATKNGHPVAVRLSVTLIYRLDPPAK
jgi:TonB family protein